MRIGDREIGLNHDPFVIAEIGVNYDNDLALAEELIKAAVRAGADVAKFQTYTPSKIVAINSPKYWEDDRPGETQYEFFQRSNKFYHEETKILAELCEKHGIPFMSTPFDLESVDFLDSLGVPAFKVASADITNYPLLKKIAKTGKPVILSTGAATIGEIQDATRIIEEAGNSNIVLLHCILAYPTPPEHANLRMISNLRKLFPQYEVGWSDHVIPNDSVVVPTVAVAMGATVIEKHFTIDRSRKGNDHFHSVDEVLMRRLVENVRIARQSLGQYLKQPVEVEAPARANARRSIAAKRDIKQGEVLNEENLTLLRPGTGIHPMFLEQLYGLCAKRDIKALHLLEWKDILE